MNAKQTALQRENTFEKENRLVVLCTDVVVTYLRSMYLWRLSSNVIMSYM